MSFFGSLRDRLPRSRSLRFQFNIALTLLAGLVLAGGLTAEYTLRQTAESTRRLADERLAQMQQAQDLARISLEIERDAYLLTHSDSHQAMDTIYGRITGRLRDLEELERTLGSGGTALILTLREAGQRFRNTANIVAQLKESALQRREAYAAAIANRKQATQDPGPRGLINIYRALDYADSPAAVDELRQQFQSQARKLPNLPPLLQNDLEAMADEQTSNRDPFTLRLRLLHQRETTPSFERALQHQAETLRTSAQSQSDALTRDYRTAVGQLADGARRYQKWVLLLLAGALVLAWLLAHHFLGRHVLARLYLVSHYLRRGDEAPETLPVQGQDEIAAMARAVEQFLADRRQLAAVNTALEEERAHQDELIKELAEAHTQLLQSEKMASIGQLAAGVAHEINNPVGFVNSNLGTLKDYMDDLLSLIAAYEDSEEKIDPDTHAQLKELKERLDIAYLKEDVRPLLDESLDGLERVRRIVQDLKEFSHVDDSGRQWTNLEQGLDSTLNVVWNEIKYKAKVNKQYAGVPEVECIPSQINQVFMNLLMNAAQSIDTQGHITIHTGYNDDSVWVEVEDNGKGISPEHLGRIFEPFFTTKPVGKGTGLGLSISYGIVEKHGGTLTAKSEVGVGSTFCVTLPRQAPTEPMLDAVETVH